MKIIIIGTFPPPIHGMAIINQAIFDRLILDGWKVEKIDTSPQSLTNQALSRMSRIRIFFSAWLYLMTANLKNSCVCLALSGGWGQVYDVVTAFICRIKGARFILHHHSVAYLHKKRIITTILFRVTGRDSIHVALCESMKNSLEKKYGCKKVILLSNSALSFQGVLYRERNKIQTIGYLSNVTKEKGGWDVIKLAKTIHEKAWPIKFRVAGPCQDFELSRALQVAQEQGVLEWVGPVFREEKRNFWNSLDLFIFPSQNEAEPLVVWEALLSGIPVIAYDRGCISAQIGEAGKIIPTDVGFVDSAMDQIDLWMNDIDLFRISVRNAEKVKGIVRILAEKQWDEFNVNLKQDDFHQHL